MIHVGHANTVTGRTGVIMHALSGVAAWWAVADVTTKAVTFYHQPAVFVAVEEVAVGPAPNKNMLKAMLKAWDYPAMFKEPLESGWEEGVDAPEPTVVEES